MDVGRLDTDIELDFVQQNLCILKKYIQVIYLNVITCSAIDL